jgi:hypothetical protein
MKYDPTIESPAVTPRKNNSWLLQSSELSPLLQSTSKHLPVWRILTFSALGFGIAMFQTVLFLILCFMFIF